MATDSHVGLATIPSSLLLVGSVRRLGSPCLWDCDQITGETNRYIVRVTSKNVLVQSEHFLHKVGKTYCGTYCLQLHNTRTWPFQSFVSRFQRHPKHRLVCTETDRLVMAATRRAVAVVQNVFTACQFKPHPWIMWPVRWPGSRCMNGSFQSVAESISLPLKEKLKREVRLRLTCLSSEWEQGCYEMHGNAVAFS